ncbi:uncharacterized protein LOC128241914 [Mya arenaria]|uniref:uncharacterized protein LOC128241914 n=1 Tax=Mya arenaria TaxID=6604 RepID=UPI0022E1F687|nr:uncharacterized protein LOC128241914 [Mya arenaria]
MEQKILFVAVIFAFAAEAAMAIKCYKCSYQSSLGTTTGMANCEDDFKADGIATIDNDPVTGDPCTVCTKNKGEHDDTKTVVYERTCSSVQQKEDCTSGELSGIEVDVCICKTDLCNSGNSIMMSFGAIALSAFAYLLY